MEKICLTKEATIADFRYAFAQKYTYIYFRVENNKTDVKNLLSSFDGYQANAELSFAGNQTVEQFEKTAGKLTGAAIQLYIEIEKNKKFKYIVCAKEFPGKTLDELEAMAKEMDAVSQVEYMKQQAESIENSKIKKGDAKISKSQSEFTKEQLIEKTSYFRLEDESLVSDEAGKKQAYYLIVNELNEFQKLIDGFEESDSSIEEKTAAIDKILRYNINLLPLLNFTAEGEFIAGDIEYEGDTIMSTFKNLIEEKVWIPLSDSICSFDDVVTLINLFFPTGLTFFESVEYTNALYERILEFIDNNVSTEDILTIMWSEEFYNLRDECPDVADAIEEVLKERDKYEILTHYYNQRGCFSRSFLEQVVTEFSEQASEDQKKEMADCIEELKADWES